MAGAYDFSVPAAQTAWVSRVAAFYANSSGALNGAFIDGNRGGWGSSILSGTSPAHAAAWSMGLAAAHAALAAALGPNGTLISNYFTTEAEAVCSGGMIERGGSVSVRSRPRTRTHTSTSTSTRKNAPQTPQINNLTPNLNSTQT